MSTLDHMIRSARNEAPAWDEARAARVLARVRDESAIRERRQKRAIVGLSLVAAAALFCARAAAGATDVRPEATGEPTYAAAHDALGLGDAGLLTD